MTESILLPKDIHQLVDVLGTTLDAKNAYTCGHSERVADYALIISQALHLSEREQMRIHIGAHLHDIGKIGIPDAILNKNGKLTFQEFEVMKKHPGLGANIVEKVEVLHPIIDIVKHHHERMDGRGYPDGLKQEEISLAARIVAIADSFDAMTSIRAYRGAMTYTDALHELKNNAGTQFDKYVVTKILEKNIFSENKEQIC